MASHILRLSCEWNGMDECHASMETIARAFENAHFDDQFDINANGEGIYFQGMQIAVVSQELTAPGVITFTIRPSASIQLFAAWVMTRLPSTARLTWKQGWPMIHCPPNDDSEVEDDPTPLIPSLLEPA